MTTRLSDKKLQQNLDYFQSHNKHTSRMYNHISKRSTSDKNACFSSPTSNRQACSMTVGHLYMKNQRRRKVSRTKVTFLIDNTYNQINIGSPNNLIMNMK